MSQQPKYNARIFPVERVQTECYCVVLLKWRKTNSVSDEETDGVLLQAWHKDSEGAYYEQVEVLEMPEDMVHGFIRDFSSVSAQEFVDKFEF